MSLSRDQFTSKKETGTLTPRSGFEVIGQSKRGQQLQPTFLSDKVFSGLGWSDQLSVPHQEIVGPGPIHVVITTGVRYVHLGQRAYALIDLTWISCRALEVADLDVVFKVVAKALSVVNIDIAVEFADFGIAGLLFGIVLPGEPGILKGYRARPNPKLFQQPVRRNRQS